jgi:predicted nucleotidyltransferase
MGVPDSLGGQKLRPRPPIRNGVAARAGAPAMENPPPEGHIRGMTTVAPRVIGSRRNLRVPRRRIAEFCRRNHIRRLALFGSVLRDDFTPTSDIDVLVEFQPGHRPGLAFFEMEDELSRILGRKVDLNTPEFVSRHFREEVLREAEPLYVAS